MNAAVKRSGPSRPPPPPPLAASAAAIEAVLGNDDILCEILLRLGFPTCLVRAAAVSKRWLRQVSDPAFLRRFRDRNPPRLLGFYLTSLAYHHRRRLADFVPMLPQPLELSSMLRRGCFSLSAYEGPTLRIMDCRNGSVFISLYHPAQYKFTHGVHTPLHPARGLVTVPDFPMISHEGSLAMTSDILSQESGNGVSYFWFTMEFLMNNRGSHVCVYKLQDNVWHMLFSARTQINCFAPRSSNNLIVEDRFYVAATRTSILVLDLTSSSYSTIDLPDGVLNKGDTVLSRANDSGVYILFI